jgi:fatty acid desaturase
MRSLVTESPTTELNQPAFLRRVNALRRLDNWTNWLYLGRAYLFLALVIGAAIAFDRFHQRWGLSGLWNFPVMGLAILLVGVGQHRLVMLGHEASHYCLFRNRLLNELAFDWCCMFPLLSTTHNYRLQHMPHHQYVNDPDRDPDLRFIEGSGHHLEVPIARGRFLWQCLVKQLLWVPGLVRYMRLRARYTALGGPAGIAPAQGGRSKLLIGVGAGYILVLAGVLTALVRWGDAVLLATIPAGMWVGMLLFYVLAPDRLYPRTPIRPDVTPRWWTYQRLTYVTLLFSALAWLTHQTGAPWGVYYLILWVLPLLTTFPYLMILREELQHSGAGRERFTHTRNFEGHPLVRFAVFPMGMDYHLPHHLFPMIPHYRLRQLHKLLRETEAYNQHALGVEAIFSQPHSVVL